MTDFTREWVASRAELIATFSKPFRGMPQDKVGLSILATTDFPRALAALKAVLEETEGKTEHHGHTPLDGDDCAACLAADIRDAIETALRGES